MALELDPGFGFEELSDDELLAVDGGVTEATYNNYAVLCVVMAGLCSLLGYETAAKVLGIASGAFWWLGTNYGTK
jgi:hypothetical protein